MEKIKIDAKVRYHFDWTYGVKLSKIKEDIESLEKLGVTRIDIEVDDNYGSYSVDIKAICERLETDEEFNRRVENDKQMEENIRKRELEQLAKLKDKYKM